MKDSREQPEPGSLPQRMPKIVYRAEVKTLACEVGASCVLDTLKAIHAFRSILTDFLLCLIICSPYEKHNI